MHRVQCFFKNTNCLLDNTHSPVTTHNEAIMRIAKKIDRAFQWAGERMGGEAKTTHSDDFKMLEMEMSLRNDGT